MSAFKKRRQLKGFVAMPNGYRETARVRELLAQVASELSDCKLDLVFAHEKVPTHFLLRRDLRRLVARADVMFCLTDGQERRPFHSTRQCCVSLILQATL